MGYTEQSMPGSVLILVEPGLDYTVEGSTIEQLNQRVYDGSIMVLSGSYRKYFTYSGDMGKSSTLSNLAAFEPGNLDVAYHDLPYGTGKYRLIPESALFLNSSLREEGTATSLVSALWDFRDKPIIFLERGSGSILSPSSKGSKSPFALLNTTWQAILVQCIIGLILLAFFWNQRLGFPLPYKEEILRDENEDVLALAGIMEQAGLGTDASLLYHSQFEKEACSYFKMQVSGSPELIEQLWNQHKLNHLEKLEEVHRCISSTKKVSGESIVRFFQNLDILRKEIMKK